MNGTIRALRMLFVAFIQYSLWISASPVVHRKLELVIYYACYCIYFSIINYFYLFHTIQPDGFVAGPPLTREELPNERYY